MVLRSEVIWNRFKIRVRALRLGVAIVLTPEADSGLRGIRTWTTMVPVHLALITLNRSFFSSCSFVRATFTTGATPILLLIPIPLVLTSGRFAFLLLVLVLLTAPRVAGAGLPDGVVGVATVVDCKDRRRGPISVISTGLPPFAVLAFGLVIVVGLVERGCFNLDQG